MAAPSGISWGNVYNGKGRLGIYTSVSRSSNTDTQVVLNVEIWFWTKYSCVDSSNALYYNAGESVSSASSSKGSVSINHKIASGEGWSTSNQTKIYNTSHTISKGSSAKSYKIYAKLSGIDYVGSTIYASKTYSVPALPKYTISYNANGGSGAPSNQTKTYGVSLTLSSTKPTRSGHSFLGWSASLSAATPTWRAGGSYTNDASDTLYAVWEANTYTIKYDVNGGRGTIDNGIKTHGVTLKLSTTVPTRKNYTFKGWSTSKTAMSATYSAGGNYTANSAATLYAVWTLSYAEPRLTNLSVTRCNSSGTNQSDGTYAKVSFGWATDLSISSAKIEYKLATATSWTSTTVSASGTSGTVSQVIGGGNLSAESQYNIRVTITDSSEGSTNQIKLLPSTVYCLDFLKGGKGVAVGKVAEKENFLDVYWQTHFDKPIMTGQKTGFSDGKEGTYISEDGIILLQRTYTQGDSESGDPYIAFLIDDATSYSGCISLTHDTKNMWFDKANDYYIKPSSAGTNISYKPYYRKYDSITAYIWTAGYVSSGGNNVYISIPLSKPVIGSPTVTVTTSNGVILRQNGKYTHGSTSSVGVTPTKLTATLSGNGSFIRLNMQFSAMTNAVNNAPVGVSFDGIIEFS